MPLNQAFFKALVDHIRTEETFEYLKSDLAGMNWFKKLTEPDDIVQGITRFFGEEYAEQVRRDLDSNLETKEIMAKAIQETIVHTFENKFTPPKPASEKSKKQEEIANNMKKLHQGTIGEDELSYLNEHRDRVVKLKALTDPLEIVLALKKLHATEYVKDLNGSMPDEYVQGRGDDNAFVKYAQTLQHEFVSGFSEALKKANMPALDAPKKDASPERPILRQLGSVREKAKTARKEAVGTLKRKFKFDGKSGEEQ